jgi:hypothetical protein
MKGIMNLRLITIFAILILNANIILAQKNDTVVYEFKIPEFLRTNDDNKFEEACFCFDSNNNQIEFLKTNDDNQIINCKKIRFVIGTAKLHWYYNSCIFDTSKIVLTTDYFKLSEKVWRENIYNPYDKLIKSDTIFVTDKLIDQYYINETIDYETLKINRQVFHYYSRK